MPILDKQYQSILITFYVSSDSSSKNFCFLFICYNKTLLPNASPPFLTQFFLTALSCYLSARRDATCPILPKAAHGRGLCTNLYLSLPWQSPPIPIYVLIVFPSIKYLSHAQAIIRSIHKAAYDTAALCERYKRADRTIV